MNYEPNIIETDLDWKSPRTLRASTSEIVIHHAAINTASVYDVHNFHLNSTVENFIGIAYNFYIRKDGSIYEGRGWDYVGGHTSNHNSVSVGICCEGYYHYDNNGYTQKPPNAQLSSLIKMVAKAMEKYSLNIDDVYGHYELNSTACPGNLFPLEEVKNAAAVYSDVDTACARLLNKGVIDSPEYWVNCYWQLANLDTLLIRLGNMCTYDTNGRVYTSINSALTQLVSAGVIDSPDYWRNNYTEIQYLGDLIKSAASHTEIIY